MSLLLDSDPYRGFHDRYDYLGGAQAHPTYNPDTISNALSPQPE